MGEIAVCGYRKSNISGKKRKILKFRIFTVVQIDALTLGRESDQVFKKLVGALDQSDLEIFIFRLFMFPRTLSLTIGNFDFYISHLLKPFENLYFYNHQGCKKCSDTRVHT